MTSVNLKERQINIGGLNINFKQIGSGDVPIVILHGWGISSDKYLLLGEYLSEVQNPKSKIQSFKILIPDLPGFGKSDEPAENWDLDDYVEFTEKFIETATRGKGFELIRNILRNFSLNDVSGDILMVKKEASAPQKIILIGHSFGGRIAIKYAVRHPEKLEKLVLTGAAGIRHPLTKKQQIFFTIAKIGKIIISVLKEAKFPIGSLAFKSKKLLYGAAKEKDYNSATPKMKEVMKKIINEDLTPVLDKIGVPTFLIWGKEDRSTPISDGNIMHSKINGSEFFVIENANHSLPYQKPEEFARFVLEFIKK